MDRVDFLHSIRSDTINTSNIIDKYFDQYMLLYDLVDNAPCTISILPDMGQVNFILDSDEKSLNNIQDKMSMGPIQSNKYLTTYMITCNRQQTGSLMIQFLK